MKHSSRLRPLIRIAPLVVLLIVIAYQRVPILTAPRPAQVISAAGQSDFRYCFEAARSFLSSIDAADLDHESTGTLTTQEAVNIANRVLARHQNNWLVGVYEFPSAASDQIVSSVGEPIDIWWFATGTVTHKSSGSDYRTWRSEVTIVYLDAVSGAPLLLVEKVPLAFVVDARLNIGSMGPCGASGDLLSTDFPTDSIERWRQRAGRILPLYLLALYGLGLLGFYLIPRILPIVHGLRKKRKAP